MKLIWRLGRSAGQLIVVAAILQSGQSAVAATTPPTNPQSGSIGLQGTISAPPPTTAATITTPGNGQVFTSTPITVAGLCSGKVIVKIFKNGVFAGSVPCDNGSFRLQIDLFSGKNDLVAKISDLLDQDGPDSATVSVIFNDARFGGAGSRVAITSNYVKRGVDPGQTLNWPIILTGGTGPYAISVDWGDGQPSSLISQETSGVVNLQHVYASPGTYNIVIKVTDKNGDAAFLQVVGVANGAVADNTATSSLSKQQPIINIPVGPMLLLLVLVALISFWLGSRHALLSLRRRLESGGNNE